MVSSFGEHWDARLTFPDGVVHEVTSPTRAGCQKLIDRLLASDAPGGV